MSAALYIFRLVWPFLKELLLGGMTLREGMRTQKKKVFLLFFVSALIISLFMIVPRFVILSQEHTKLEQSVSVLNVKKLEDKIKELEQVPVAGAKDVSIEPIEATEPTPINKLAPLVPKPIKPRAEKTPKKPEVSVPPQTTDQDKRKKGYMDFFDNINK